MGPMAAPLLVRWYEAMSACERLYDQDGHEAAGDEPGDLRLVSTRLRQNPVARDVRLRDALRLGRMTAMGAKQPFAANHHVRLGTQLTASGGHYPGDATRKGRPDRSRSQSF